MNTVSIHTTIIFSIMIIGCKNSCQHTIDQQYGHMAFPQQVLETYTMVCPVEDQLIKFLQGNDTFS